MILFAAGYLITLLLNAGLGAIVLVRNPKCESNRVYFVLTVLVVFLAFNQFEFVKAESVERALFWYRLGRVAWPLFFALLLHFTAMYTRPVHARLSVPLGILIYAPASILVFVLWLSPISEHTIVTKIGEYWVQRLSQTASTAGIVSIAIGSLYTFIIAAWSIVHLVQAPTQDERGQRLVVLVGLMTGLLWSGIFFAVLPEVGVRTPDIGQYGFGLGCAVLGIAVWRLKLFKLDVVAAAEEIVRAMPTAVILLAPDNTIVRVNEAGQRLLGLPHADSHDGNFLDRFPGQARVRMERTLAGSAAGVSADTEILGPDDEIIPISLSFSPVSDEKGKRVGTVCLGRDVRGELEIEAEKRELEERLRQSEKMEAIGRLAGGVAHDFNNILAGILGYADLILSNPDSTDRKIRGYADNIVAGSKRAARLVSNLLTFARTKQLKLEAVDINRITLQVAELLEHSIDKRIEVELSLDTACPLVLADAAQLHNAILNLAINARDAIESNGNIHISTLLSHLGPSRITADNLGIEPGSYVLLSVEDTGSGISSESIGRIFDPFFTTKEVGRGTGLGLASVYGTAHACGGTVTVDSHEGQGSTFSMYLPATATEDEVENHEDQHVTGETANVLVIDDEDLVRDVTRVTLETMGYSVYSSGDGVEGLDFIRQNPNVIDLVILDLNMPGHSGYEVFDALESLAPGLPVVISTGLLSVGDGASELRERAAGFLQKPFGRAQLSSVVEEALRSARGKKDS